jgi:hypothetical protein
LGQLFDAVHAFDRQLALRCFALGLVLVLLCTGVIVATDEAGSTLGLRAARLSAMLPGLVVVAQQIALGQSEAKGETRALVALGVSPWRAARGAVFAGWVFGGAALGLLASPLADVRSLFPAVAAPAAWAARDGALFDARNGAAVSADGTIQLERDFEPPATIGAPSRRAALACIAPLAAVVPAWGVIRLGLGARLAGAAVAAGLAITLLHAVAGGRLGPLWLSLASAPLVLQAAFALSRRRLG